MDDKPDPAETFDTRARRRRLTPRFDRVAWLEAALEVLAQEGNSKLRIENLSRDLGVTRGSFYHHFNSREEFIAALAEYWVETTTEQTNAKIASLDIPAAERLLTLMQMIREHRLDRYDIAFRSWAAQNPKVAEQVRRVDLVRHKFVRELFAEMGFEGADLDDRVRMWLVYECSKGTVGAPEGVEDDEEFLRRRFNFFTQPVSDRE